MKRSESNIYCFNLKLNIFFYRNYKHRNLVLIKKVKINFLILPYYTLKVKRKFSKSSLS